MYYCHCIERLHDHNNVGKSLPPVQRDFWEMKKLHICSNLMRASTKDNGSNEKQSKTYSQREQKFKTCLNSLDVKLGVTNLVYPLGYTQVNLP